MKFEGFFLQKKLSLFFYDFGIFWRMISLSSIEAAGKSQAGKKKQTKTWNFHMANLGFWTGGVAPKRLQWFEHLGSRNQKNFLNHFSAYKLPLNGADQPMEAYFQGFLEV